MIPRTMPGVLKEEAIRDRENVPVLWRADVDPAIDAELDLDHRYEIVRSSEEAEAPRDAEPWPARRGLQSPGLPGAGCRALDYQRNGKTSGILGATSVEGTVLTIPHADRPPARGSDNARLVEPRACSRQPVFPLILTSVMYPWTMRLPVKPN